MNPFNPDTHPDEYAAWEMGTADGAALLDELHAVLMRYVVLPSPEAVDAVVCWIAATHAQACWEHAPRIAAISPEKRCGKSRLMDIVEATAWHSIVTVNISPAALVRCVTIEDPPALFIDEADTIFGPKASDNHEDLRGIVNSGHQRNRPYIRWDPTARKTEVCPTFAMAMLAGIGDLPDTIMDRAIVIRMRRRSPAETVDPYRTRRDGPALRELRDQLHDWLSAPDLRDALVAAEPAMPVEDRAADTWEPLVAIADAAGGNWPKRIRTAVLRLVAAEAASDAEASLGIRLLFDIRDVFTTWTVSFIASTDLLAALNKIDDAPWRELNLTARGIADRLRPYGIKPTRNTGGTARGYRLEDFGDAFTRYARQNPSNRQSPAQGTVTSDASDTSSVRRPQASDTLSSQSDSLTGSDAPLWPEGRCGLCGQPSQHGVCWDCTSKEFEEGDQP